LMMFVNVFWISLLLITGLLWLLGSFLLIDGVSRLAKEIYERLRPAKPAAPKATGEGVTTAGRVA